MIVSVSRRTDIPALYGEWFIRRLRAGEVYQRNPFNQRQVHKIPLSQDAVDAFVFWTKDPAPFMPLLDHLEGYPYYFHFTLTPYGREVEPAFTDKKRLLETFKALAAKIGPSRVIWRYDPILISETYTASWHEKTFKDYAKALNGVTDKVIVSFVDFYKKAGKALKALGAYDPPLEDKKRLIRTLKSIAKENGMDLELCSEPFDMSREGVPPSRCIDPVRIKAAGGPELDLKKDPNQRAACGCVISKDIGAYDTCVLGCKYCYAVKQPKRATARFHDHDPESPLLNDTLRGDETIYAVNLKKY
ncbi:MAG: DUF1848 domain-containing protein [Bacillota bacterium]